VVLNAPCTFATDKTLFGVPAVSYGWFPDASLSFHLSRLGSLGKFLALSSYQLTGEDLVTLGLLHLYSTSEQAKTLEEGFETVWSNKIERVAYTLLNSCSQLGGAGGSASNYSAPIEVHLELIERCFSFDSLEEIMDSLEKEGGGYNLWAKDVLTYIKNACPLSLKVTMELLSRAKDSSLEDCLSMEYRLALKFRVSTSTTTSGEKRRRKKGEMKEMRE
jgi:3-hydroxyisobutyryl-CoA hydrolase